MILVQIGLITLLSATVYGAEWDHITANTWAASYPACAKPDQSPIDLPASGEDLFYTHMPPFLKTGYNSDNVPMTMVNNGHTVQINIDNKTQVFIQGGGLLTSRKYYLEQMHFHWGSTYGQGSEHTLYGRAYEAELHFVHHDEFYGGIGNAADDQDGLAVLGVFLQVYGGEDNAAYAPLIDHLQQVRDGGSEVKITQSFRLDSLLPRQRLFFYRYEGSLTTPPCHESVTWTVYSEPVLISERQMNEFRMLMEKPQGDPNNKPILDNYRPIQPLNRRKIFVNVQPTGDAVVMKSSVPTIVSLLIAMLMSSVF